MPTLDHAPVWEFRWPDPVAIQVASERILRELRTRASADGTELTSLNLRLPVMVRMESTAGAEELARALLLTPWGVERIYWHPHGQEQSSIIESAFPLEADTEGRVAKGQGVLLRVAGSPRPVLIGWEPETGHYFVETLLHSVQEFDTIEEAFNMAQGVRPLRKPKMPTISDQMQRQVSRRQLLGFWRGGS
ncbi:MAG: hypothetical protein H7833_03320 [Magnetococcus sp. DMHC-1]|nr:hypothetical protein [Magnetococcales bacterium]